VIQFTGDVKYHMGASGSVMLQGGPRGSPPRKVELSIAPNPSHLEATNPVVLGMVMGSDGIKAEHGRGIEGMTLCGLRGHALEDPLVCVT